MRISQATEVGGSVVLRLEGKMSGQWVDELRRLTSEILQKPATRLVLDLADVSFIDADGLELLHELSSRHVILRNGSLFVTQQLKAIRPLKRSHEEPDRHRTSSPGGERRSVDSTRSCSPISMRRTGWRCGWCGTSTMQKTSCRMRCCTPFDTFGPLPAETGAPGSSRSCATRVGAGVSGTFEGVNRSVR